MTFAAKVLDQIVQVVDSVGRSPLLVAIDGQGGAGKSIMALALAKRLGTDRAAVVQGDDFYRDMPEPDRESLTPEQGVEQFFDWQRLQRLMESVRAAEPQLTYRPYDWRLGQLADNVVSSPMPEVVIVDGVYSLREQLRDLVDIGIWIETSAAERLNRIRDRGQNTEAQIERWEQAERAYVLSQDPASIADLRVEGASEDRA